MSSGVFAILSRFDAPDASTAEGVMVEVLNLIPDVRPLMKTV